MVGLGFVMLFAGYTLGTYGWSQVRGCNAGFVAILWPSSKSFTGCNPDGSGNGTSATTTQLVPNNSGLTESRGEGLTTATSPSGQTTVISGKRGSGALVAPTPGGGTTL